VPAVRVSPTTYSVAYITWMSFGVRLGTSRLVPTDGVRLDEAAAYLRAGAAAIGVSRACVGDAPAPWRGDLAGLRERADRAADCLAE
jgi:2-keto-3-deoxy-6-phosphogluconate aldolase